MREEVTAIDEEEFVLVVRKFGTDVLRFARSQLPTMHDAEDVYQETFRVLYQSGRRFESDEHLRRWLFSVVSNQCKHFYRTRIRKALDVFDPTSPKFQKLCDGSESTAQPDYMPDHDVWDYVAALPRAQREVIALFYVEGYSVEEIASIVHARPVTIRTRLFRARQALKHDIEKGGTLGY